MKRKKMIVAAAAVCTAALTAGTVMAAMPGKGLTGWYTLLGTPFRVVEAEAEKEPEAEIQTPMLESALREYFGLDEGEGLTADLLAQVKTIRFELSAYNGTLPGEYADKVAVRCVVNDGALPGVVRTDETRTYDRVAYEFLPMSVRMKYFDISSITDTNAYCKYNSFFTRKDSKDLSLTEEGVAELHKLFPNTMADAIIMCDPEAKPRELKDLAEVGLEYGLAHLDTLFDSTVIPFASADVVLFPNLFLVVCEDGLTVEYVD